MLKLSRSIVLISQISLSKEVFQLKQLFVQTVLLLALCTLCVTGSKVFAQNQTQRKSESTFQNKKRADHLSLQNSIGVLPILFEENKGQTSPNIRFLSHGSSFNLFLNRGEIVFQMPDAKCEHRKTGIKNQNLKSCKTLSLTMKVVGANANSIIRGIDQAVTKSGYFIGNDESLWLNDINNFQTVEYGEIYPGINLMFGGSAEKIGI